MLKGFEIDAVFLDCEKDTAAHYKTLCDLRDLGVPSDLISLFSNFLSDDMQSTLVDGFASDGLRDTSRVPSESTFVPLPFLCLINSVCSSVSANTGVRSPVNDVCIF